jgi:phospholipase C
MQGAVFHVYDVAHLDRIPRRYTVEAGKQLSDTWDTAATDAGNYQLQVYAPNGFYRSFLGNTLAQSNVAFNPEGQICYDPSSGDIYLKVHNTGSGFGTVTVTSNAYRTDGPWTMTVAANSTESLNWDLRASGRWYDFTVTSGTWQRRFAGRVETGADSISDPAMGLNL